MLLSDNWRLVYFSHANCFPMCQPAYQKLRLFEQGFGSADIMTAVIDLDTEPMASGLLASELFRRGYDFAVYSSDDSEVIEQITRTFIALFLRTDFSDDQYQIEQKHDLFLMDPKNRVYAVFEEDIPFSEIQRRFVEIRSFYAKSEQKLAE